MMVALIVLVAFIIIREIGVHYERARWLNIIDALTSKLMARDLNEYRMMVQPAAKAVKIDKEDEEEQDNSDEHIGEL